MLKTRIALLVVPVLMAGSFGVSGAQDRDRDNRGNGGFYNGVRDGGSNGSYDQEVHPRYNRRYRHNYNNNGYGNNGYGNNGYGNNGYNNSYNNRDDRGQYNHGDYQPYRRQQGGIGPGKGALIGGAGGAVLGALFGHGLGSTLIGGAAGAGIGAVVGKVHQDRQRDQNGNYYPQ